MPDVCLHLQAHLPNRLAGDDHHGGDGAAHFDDARTRALLHQAATHCHCVRRCPRCTDALAVLRLQALDAAAFPYGSELIAEMAVTG